MYRNWDGLLLNGYALKEALLPKELSANRHYHTVHFGV